MNTPHMVTDLMELEVQLEALPNEVALSSRARARIRTQVMAQAYQGRPAEVGLWDRIAAAFSPRLMTRPIGAALSVVAAIALAGSTTASAAMDSLPGDGLYPVKTAYERSCLVLAGSEESQAQCHLWMASSRLVEIERAGDAGRLDAVEKSSESYGVSVGVALTLAANSKQPEKMQEQFSAVQSSLKEVYEKASDAVKPLLPIALATNAPAAAPNRSVSNTDIPTQPVTENTSQPPVDPVFIDEGQAIAAAPAGSSWIQDKTGANGEAATGKDQPVSAPPVGPQPLDPAPAKNSPGPATGPLPTKSDSMTAVEPEKSEPEAVTPPAPGPSKDGPSSSESPVPSKEQNTLPAAPAPEGKPSIVVQGQGLSIPIR